MIKLIILGVVVLAAVVAFKLWKANKVVTAGTVVAGVEADVTKAVDTVKTDVSKKL